jgi:hypothetical protein
MIIIIIIITMNNDASYAVNVAAGRSTGAFACGSKEVTIFFV